MKKTILNNLSAKLAVVALASCVFFLGEALLTPDLGYSFPFVAYGGTFRYARLSVGPVSVSLYWLAQGAGVLGMVFMCLSRRRQYGVEKFQAVLTGILLAVFGYLGAKLLYIAENWERVLERGISVNGVSFFGTVFLMPLVIPVMGLIFRKRPLDYLDYCTPAGLLMLACIRVGCFMNGCCHGITLWVMSRPVTLPSQLLECTLDLLLLEALFWLEKKGTYRGLLYFAFMGGYGILRFIVEFTRDTAKDVFGLSHGQCFSLCCIAVGAAALFIWKKRVKIERKGQQ